MMWRKVIAASLIVLIATAAPTQALAGAARAEAAQRPPAALVLPQGAELDEEELDQVQGKFFKTVLVGAVSGVVVYSAGKLYDRLTTGRWSWSWREAGRAAFTGAVAGFMGRW
ncbi:MAG: hypothetical protein H0Z37_00725 [Firmicutes bacterium]|nr:hypothetical protein [Bacillota bacterium]